MCDWDPPIWTFLFCIFSIFNWNQNGNLLLKQFYWMLKDSIEINFFVVWKIYRIIKELKDRKKPQVWKPIATVNKSRSPDLLFANRTLLKNFHNFPSIRSKFFLLIFNRYVILKRLEFIDLLTICVNISIVDKKKLHYKMKSNKRWKL